MQKRVGYCSNFSIDGIDAQLFLQSLDNIAISQGSACNAVDPEPSHVLTAMGLSRDMANRSFRVSVGRFTTEADIVQASEEIALAVQRLRS